MPYISKSWAILARRATEAFYDIVHKEKKSIYIVGSLRNPQIPLIGDKLREAGYDAFDCWYSAGPEADDYLRDYHRERGHSYQQALDGPAARHIFEFDKRHLDRCSIGLLVMPAGRSGHLEIGYMNGQGKTTYVLMEGEPERYDIMYQFCAGGIHYSIESVIKRMKENEDLH